jgi:hypothetical protein
MASGTSADRAYSASRSDSAVHVDHRRVQITVPELFLDRPDVNTASSRCVATIAQRMRRARSDNAVSRRQAVDQLGARHCAGHLS